MQSVNRFINYSTSNARLHFKECRCISSVLKKKSFSFSSYCSTMEDWRHPLSAVIVFVVGLAVCAGILLVASPREEGNVRIHLTPRYHTVKRHINKYSHILEETQIGLPGMREGYRRRRQKVEKGVIHLKSRGAILKDYLPSGKPTEKYKSLRGDGEGFNLSFKSCAVVHSSGMSCLFRLSTNQFAI